MGLNLAAQTKCSIHDLDIENRNRVILKRSYEVVQECKDLGIAFVELDEQVGNSVKRILHND